MDSDINSDFKSVLNPSGKQRHHVFCAAPGCGNSTLKYSSQEKTFISFPTEKKRCEQWIAKAGRTDLSGKTVIELQRKNMMLCSDHFEDTAFTDPKTRNRLNPNAIPTLFRFQPPPPPPSIPKTMVSKKKPTNKTATEISNSHAKWKQHGWIPQLNLTSPEEMNKMKGAKLRRQNKLDTVEVANMPKEQSKSKTNDISRDTRTMDSNSTVLKECDNRLCHREKDKLVKELSHVMVLLRVIQEKIREVQKVAETTELDMLEVLVGGNPKGKKELDKVSELINSIMNELELHNIEEEMELGDDSDSSDENLDDDLPGDEEVVDADSDETAEEKDVSSTPQQYPSSALLSSLSSLSSSSTSSTATASAPPRRWSFPKHIPLTPGEISKGKRPKRSENPNPPKQAQTSQSQSHQNLASTPAQSTSSESSSAKKAAPIQVIFKMENGRIVSQNQVTTAGGKDADKIDGGLQSPAVPVPHSGGKNNQQIILGDVPGGGVATSSSSVDSKRMRMSLPEKEQRMAILKLPNNTAKPSGVNNSQPEQFTVKLSLKDMLKKSLERERIIVHPPPPRGREKKPSHVICEICGQTLRRQYLDSHILTQHSNEEKHLNCQLCDKKFYTLQNLKNHMTKHSDARPYKCPQCPKAFKSSNNLKSHKMAHVKVKRYWCQRCNAGFKWNASLNLHNKQFCHYRDDAVDPNGEQVKT